MFLRFSRETGCVPRKRFSRRIMRLWRLVGPECSFQSGENHPPSPLVPTSLTGPTRQWLRKCFSDLQGKRVFPWVGCEEHPLQTPESVKEAPSAPWAMHALLGVYAPDTAPKLTKGACCPVSPREHLFLLCSSQIKHDSQAGLLPLMHDFTQSPRAKVKWAPLGPI